MEFRTYVSVMHLNNHTHVLGMKHLQTTSNLFIIFLKVSVRWGLLKSTVLRILHDYHEQVNARWVKRNDVWNAIL